MTTKIKVITKNVLIIDNYYSFDYELWVNKRLVSSGKIRDDYWHDNPKKDEKSLKKYGAVRIVLEENINKILS